MPKKKATEIATSHLSRLHSSSINCADAPQSFHAFFFPWSPMLRDWDDDRSKFTAQGRDRLLFVLVRFHLSVLLPPPPQVVQKAPNYYVRLVHLGGRAAYNRSSGRSLVSAEWAGQISERVPHFHHGAYLRLQSSSNAFRFTFWVGWGQHFLKLLLFGVQQTHDVLF